MAGVSKWIVSSPSSFTLTQDYKTYVDSLIMYFRNSETTRQVLVPPETGYLYRFDLTQFLLANNVPLEDHYLVMRVNGFTSVHQIDETINNILVPDQALIARFKQIYRTSLNVS
ncbi:hypothetical protein D3C80_1525200 [compost metagenome]